MESPDEVIELEVQGPKEDLLQMQRTGKVTQALEEYARKCSESLAEGDYYLAQICIEQMTELLGTASKKDDWTSAKYFEHNIKPKLREMLEKHPSMEGYPSKGNPLFDELVELAELKFTSSEFKPPKPRLLKASSA